MTTNADTLDKELAAVKSVFEALAPLDETGRRFVQDTVAARLGTLLPVKEARETLNYPQQGQASARQPRTGSGASPRLDGQRQKEVAKKFLREKGPTSEVQRIACLAYHLTHSEGQDLFKTKELKLLNSDAGQPRMSNPSTTVANAEKCGFLTPAGRGRKQITTLGEDVVKALPDKEAVKAVLSARRKPRKRRAKKAAAK